ncbi:signal peptidase II [Legionella anisa]|uniref:Lipoprotein signal peptidase n=1 Tax=Legionella anisa TaxID=28082 RepID=A0AAX0WRY2_9GAMM|nr:signal peptidase II [Legionella anisa]AWN74731.1 lipoprotein signal peptidase [Legionella anisa]KTC77528.1 lipoprotein signal peptidase [Legionella anisa]MBN5934911.1 lipoprotein signal peptidase [Legionella anisa]MCW8425147.1 signal peptidase II [Legionella anisa]MCW8445737.1 signal peptidase II [Legionella anisa]
MRKWPWFMLSLIVIVFDQASKYLASVFLTPYKPLPVFPMFNFTLAYNSGAAFSFLSGAGDWHRWFFAGFSFIVSVILAVWLYRTESQARFLLAGISLILGGAIGNLIDRALDGYVIDFIDVYYKHHHFATFNLADSAICIGAGFFLLDLLINRE